jgi:hypothetical protein
VPVRGRGHAPVDGAREVGDESYRCLAERDPLTAAVLDRMLAGVSTRRFVRTGTRIGSEVDELLPSKARPARPDAHRAAARGCPGRRGTS